MPVVIALVAVKNVFLLIFFLVGCLAIAWSQYLWLSLLQGRQPYSQDLVCLTKTQFIELLTFVLSYVNPSTVTITYDPRQLPQSDSFKELPGGVLSSILMPNSIVISNHQIYTDWFYLWFLSYTAKLSHGVFIILKDLSKIPVLGYGMKNFNFMFLSRKWAKDKVTMTNQLLVIDADARGSGPGAGVKYVSSTNITGGIGEVKTWPQQRVSDNLYPYFMILYPEGTVPSDRTTKKSREFCLERGIPPFKHVLCPRIRGLFLVLKELQGTVEVVYDVTCCYSGLKPGEFGEDKFTLKKTFFCGQGAKQVNYHIRSFKLDDIPLGKNIIDIDKVSDEDYKKFEDWVYKVWCEKDARMELFYQQGSFSEPGDTALKTVKADIKLPHWYTIFPPFATLFATCLLLRIAWIGVRAFFFH